jgi:hypothetical protein
LGEDTFSEGTVRNAVNGIDPMRPGRIKVIGKVLARYGDGVPYKRLIARNRRLAYIMSDAWHTSISVGINNDCPMEFRVQLGGIVEFWACRSGGKEEFDMSFESAALRRFLDLGASALAKAEARVAAEQARTEESDDVDGGCHTSSSSEAPSRIPSATALTSARDSGTENTTDGRCVHGARSSA